MIYQLELSDRTIKYDLQRKKVKNINLRVKPNGDIFVSANKSVSVKSISDFILSKESFITKALDNYAELRKYAPKPKEYVDGETFLICGHERRLKVKAANKNYVESDETYIYLFVKDTANTMLKKKTMDKWFKTQCKETVSLTCEAIYPKFKKYGIAFPELRFRNMISRWGSCQPKRGSLTFNISLIETPMSCIEYVVVHEFTHFLQPNHSKLFYTQLTMFMPDWPQRKKLLEMYSVNIQ